MLVVVGFVLRPFRPLWDAVWPSIYIYVWGLPIL